MKNKKVYLLFLLVLLTVPMSRAQYAVCSRSNGFRDCDSLDRISLTWLPEESKGDRAVWTVPDLMEGERTGARISIASDTVTVDSPDAAYLYMERGDSVLMAGYENPTTRMRYVTPMYIGRTAMAYGDSIGGYFSGRADYCGKLALYVYGRSSTVADGYGILIAGTDTVTGVLRLHRHTEYVRDPSRQGQTDFRQWEDSVCKVFDEAPRLTEDRWRWYCAGYRYPIMESVRYSSSGYGPGSSLLERTYLFLPMEQSYTLPYDPENAAQRLYGMQSVPAYSRPSDAALGELTVEARLMPDGRTVDVSYGQDFEGTVTFIASDVMGHLLASSSVSAGPGTHQLSMALDRKPVGDVVMLHIESGSMAFSLKVTKED